MNIKKTDIRCIDRSQRLAADQRLREVAQSILRDVENLQLAKLPNLVRDRLERRVEKQRIEILLNQF